MNNPRTHNISPETLFRPDPNPAMGPGKHWGNPKHKTPGKRLLEALALALPEMLGIHPYGVISAFKGGYTIKIFKMLSQGSVVLAVWI